MRICALLLLATVLQAEEPRFTVDLKNFAVPTIVNMWQTYAGQAIVLDDAYADKEVSIKLKNATVPEAITELARQLGGAAWKRSKDNWHIAPKWNIALRKKLATTKLDAVVGGPATLGNNLMAIRLMSRLNIVADPQLDLSQRVPWVKDAGNLEIVLDKLTASAKCGWDLRWGVVYVASKKRLGALPRSAAFAVKGPVVDLKFRKTPLQDAAKQIAAKSRHRLVLDPKADGKAKVTVEAKGLEPAQALAVTLLPVGHTAEIKDKTITIKPRS
ncbi:MAG: hypothetical protein ACYTGZ_02160 [Planctomycetota bacterium]|jgi:type II secretory pathway component GspD/PulD (secretin)